MKILIRMCGIVSNPMKCLFVISLLLLCIAQCSAMSIGTQRKRVQNFFTWRLVKKVQTQPDNSVFRLDEKNVTLIESFKEWSKKTNLTFFYMDNENAHIQITFGDKNCTAYKDGIVLNFTTNEGNIKSFACVYPLRGENGGDIHFIGDTEWTTIDADSHDIGHANKYDINLSTASFFTMAYVLGFNDYNENGALLPLNYYQKKEDAINEIGQLYGNPGANVGI